MENTTDPNQRWELVKDLSLPYLSPCQNPNTEYPSKTPKIIEHVREDYELRCQLIEKAKSNLYPEWWCYVHECEISSVFIIPVICRILFPNEQFYLLSGLLRNVIINSKMLELLSSANPIELSKREKSFSRDINEPLIFDIISQCIDQNFEWIFKYHNYIKIIPLRANTGELNIIEYFIKAYGYKGIEENAPKYFALYNSL